MAEDIINEVQQVSEEINQQISNKGGIRQLVSNKRKQELAKRAHIIGKYDGLYYQSDEDLKLHIKHLRLHHQRLSQENELGEDLEKAVRVNLFNNIVESDINLQERVKQKLDEKIQSEIQKIQCEGEIFEIEVEAPGTDPNQSLYNRGESTAKTDVLISLVNLIEQEKLKDISYIATCGSHQIVSHRVKGLNLYVSNETKAKTLIDEPGMRQLKRSCSFTLSKIPPQPPHIPETLGIQPGNTIGCHGQNDISDPDVRLHTLKLPTGQEVMANCEHGQSTMIDPALEITCLDDLGNIDKMHRCQNAGTILMGRICDTGSTEKFYSPCRESVRKGRMEAVSVQDAVHIQVNFNKSGKISGISLQHHLDSENAQDDKARKQLFEAIRNANNKMGANGFF